MADTWATPGYGVPTPAHASVSFGVIADPVPVGGSHVPVAFSNQPTISQLDFFGAAGGLFSLGKPASTGNTATPILHPGQTMVPTAQVNGQAGYIGATKGALQSILSFMGAQNDNQTPTVQNAAYVPASGPNMLSSYMPLMVLAGGGLVAYLAFKK